MLTSFAEAGVSPGVKAVISMTSEKGIGFFRDASFVQSSMLPHGAAHTLMISELAASIPM